MLQYLREWDIIMSKEKQILQLRSMGYSQRRIADTLKVSRNTVSMVFNASVEHPVPDAMLNTLNGLELRQLLFPEESKIPILVMPDLEYLHKELLKSGVTLRFLWDEYVDTCRPSDKLPYMYSQFCKLYQDYVNKHHLTLHVKHKPGDKIMMDWTGTPCISMIKLLEKSAMCTYLWLPSSSACIVLLKPG